jgi:MFS family permease
MCGDGAYVDALPMTNSAVTQRLRLPGGRPFHLILLSLAVSSCGDWLYNVALLAFVFQRTGSATWVALTTAGRVLPVVVLGPIGGVLADRYDRRRLIIASNIARALLMVALAAVATLGLPVIFAPLIAAAATAISVVEPPCVAACTARLVADSELPRAQALRAGIGQAAIVAGPALGAIVLLASTPAIAILLNALTFLGSAAAIVSIAPGREFRPAAHEAGAANPRVLAEIAAGARALRGASAAIRLVAADVLCSAVYGLLTVTLVLISRKVGAGDSGYGLLLGAFGVGGVIGAVVTARVEAAGRWRRTLACALALVGVPLAALGLAPTLPLALGLAFLGGGGMVVGEVLSETALPRLLDDSVLARAYGLVFPASIAGIVAGSLVAGPLLAAFGLTGALAVAGLFVLVVAALLLHRPLAAQPRGREVAIPA